MSGSRRLPASIPAILAVVACLSIVALPARAATLADPEVSFQEAVRHDRGDGVRMDLARAHALFCRAALAGHTEASYRLGRIYWAGLGTARDPLLALAWLATAAQSGHRDAQLALRLLPPITVSRTPDCKPTRTRRWRAPRAAWPEVDAALFREMASRSPIGQVVESLAPKFGLDPGLVLAVIAVESNFQPHVVSPKRAQGLMQLIPETARRFAVRDPFDPVDNMMGGMRYLAWLLAYFQGDVRLALAGYNAGEGAVDRHGGVPPYAETQQYVRRIARLYEPPTHAFDGSLARPSPTVRSVAPAARVSGAAARE